MKNPWKDTYEYKRVYVRITEQSLQSSTKLFNKNPKYIR